MKIEVKENNTLYLEFIENDIIDIMRLDKIYKAFQQLDNNKPILVQCKGDIYLEVGVYLLEVANHCKMTIETDDINIDKFKELVESYQDNIKAKIIKIKKDN